MSTYYTSSLTTPAVSTSTLNQRTVADEIRRILPSSLMLSLVSPGAVGKAESVSKKNMISKRRVETQKFERFTWSAPAVSFTVATWTDIGTTGFTLSSVDGLRPKYGLLNTRNMTTCRIGSINSTTVKATTVGSTAFTAVAGDVLLKLAPAYEQNSSAPYITIRGEDNHYGYTQISRFAVAISGSNKVEKRYGPDYWQRVKQNSVIDGFRTVEAQLLFGNMPSSGATTTDTVLGDSFQSAKGIWNWSSTSYSAGGNLSAQKFRKDMVLAMNESVQGQEKNLAFYCSRDFYGDAQEWINDKLIVNDSGEKKAFGANALRFYTAGPMTELLVHDLFSRGSLKSSALIVDPENLEYVFLKDRDFQANTDIQANDVDGVQDEFFGEYAIDVKDGGVGITKVTDVY